MAKQMSSTCVSFVECLHSLNSFCNFRMGIVFEGKELRWSRAPPFALHSNLDTEMCWTRPDLGISTPFVEFFAAHGFAELLPGFCALLKNYTFHAFRTHGLPAAMSFLTLHISDALLAPGQAAGLRARKPARSGKATLPWQHAFLQGPRSEPAEPPSPKKLCAGAQPP